MICAQGFRSVPAVVLAASLIWSAKVTAQTADVPLVLETKIPLGEVSGRIDHLSIDVKRQRLFVAELGNDSVGVVDLAVGKVLRRIPGLKEPQGVGYVPFADSVYVANAGDGSVRVLRGDDFAPAGRSNSAMMPTMCGWTRRAIGCSSATASARLQSSTRQRRPRRPISV